MNKKVMAFGSFDFLHPGHIHYLTKASRFGSYLLIVVARDSSIKRLKGRAPVFNHNERARLVGSLRIVDKAIVGNKIKKPTDMYRIISQNRPAVVAFGYDQHVNLPKLKLWLKENKMNVKVVRIRSSLKPKIYKSSKIRHLVL